MSDDMPFFLTQNCGLGRAEPTDDLLHPERNKLVTADTLSETQYFGFCIPSERIQGFCYLWHHPNLHVVSGGLFVFRGDRPTVLHGELCDFRCYMNDSVLKDDLHEYRLANGYGVKIVEPLQRFHVTYADLSRSNSIDLRIRAVQPPVMFGDGNHFEQAMAVRGELLLRGRRYDIDCFTVRDRSWGKPRTEENPAVPAVSWMVGVFSPDFAFSATIFDQQETSLELVGAGIARPIDKTVNGGWVYRDGKLGRVVKAKKRIARVPPMYIPQSIELEITDDLDRSFQLRGTSCASTLWQTWVNMTLPIVQMRWECDGMIAYGECQEGNYNDHYNLLRERRQRAPAVDSEL